MSGLRRLVRLVLPHWPWLAGGVLLVFSRTRFVGAAIVAVTFLVSLVVLLMDGNIPVSIVTAIATVLLGAVMKQSWPRSGTS